MAQYARYDRDEIAGLVKRGYIYKKTDCGTGLFCAPLLDNLGLHHGFSTREGGLSAGPYESLDLRWKLEEGAERPRYDAENFRIFARGAGIDYAAMAVVCHEHGSNVIRVSCDHMGRGFDKEPLERCDGIVTDDTEVVLVTTHADCGAYFFYDPVHNAAGLAHAGWRGTFLRIGGRMAETMSREFGTDPGDIIAAAGPCICPKCFEVDAELGERFCREFRCNLSRPGRPGKAYVDLETAAAIQFIEVGIRPENINIMGLCTYEQQEYFYSHRRDKGVTGSMAAFIKLN